MINAKNEAELRPVTVGLWQDDNWIIDEGLAAGDVVAVDGTMRLANGVVVKTAPYTPEPKPKPAAPKVAPPPPNIPNPAARAAAAPAPK